MVGLLYFILGTVAASCDLKTQVFDSINEVCLTCAESEVALNNRCVCNEKSIRVGTECKLCAKNQISDLLREKCIDQCAECDKCNRINQFVLTTEMSGETLAQSQCITCAANSFLQSI